MTRQRKSAAVPILTALLIVGVPLAAYVAGYFWLAERSESRIAPGDFIPEARGKPYIVGRFYERQWQATIYKPAAVVETWLTGFHVGTGTPTY
jgi:hypothetical protein